VAHWRNFEKSKSRLSIRYGWIAAMWVKEGSLYPALHKLRDDGLIDVVTENIGNRVRHYYSLTPEGIKIKNEKEAELTDFIRTINKIITS